MGNEELTKSEYRRTGHGRVLKCFINRERFRRASRGTIGRSVAVDDHLDPWLGWWLLHCGSHDGTLRCSGWI